MSLYHEAVEILTAPDNAKGSLKSRIFGSKSLKSQHAQIYALVIETCKWSSVLKEVIERAELLSLERKLTPILSLLLVHDLLLARRGVALPATHGLRAAVEKHKARLQAELTKARVGRKLGSMEALKQYIDSGVESGSGSEPPHPRWIRINTLKTQLEDQLETTFASYKRVGNVDAVRQRESRCVFVDVHVPNLIAIPGFIDITKSEAYTSGALIFQDKASCFPAYLLDPLPEDGDIIDTCAAPGNKTTHLAAILALHAPEIDDHVQTIHAYEKDKIRVETLKKMVTLAGCEDLTKIHGAQDFLKTDPNAPEYNKVGALLLDPSCSGSGIVGRDEMPTLHLPSANATRAPPASSGKKSKARAEAKKPTKRTRSTSPEPLDLIDDNGAITTLNSPSDLQTRLGALATFQLSLLLHAMAFPSAHKITYSTCSIHAAENEAVVTQALASPLAQERGWRILKREEQVRGMREWPIRGQKERVTYSGVEDGGEGNEGEDEDKEDKEVAEACIRANKGDEYGTMGFFLAAFVRGKSVPLDDRAAGVMRDEKGFIVRDLMGLPVMAFSGEELEEEEEEWNGFGDYDANVVVDDDEEKEAEIEMRDSGEESSGDKEMADERVAGEVIPTESETIPDVSTAAAAAAESPADVAHKHGKKRKRKQQTEREGKLEPR